MIKGLGTQLEEIGGVQSAFDRNGESLVRRILTKTEHAQWQTHRQPTVYLATLQAIKGSVAKALNTQIGQGIGYRDVEVVLGETVTIALHGGAQVRFERQGQGQWLISYSVSPNFATATTLLQS